MARVLLTGGTGFLGQVLLTALVARGDLVTVLTRNPGAARRELPRDVRVVGWDPNKKGPWYEEVGVVDAVVHLAGKPVLTRWSAKVKDDILKSRAGSTERIVEAIGEAAHKPSVFVCASATGFYGSDRASEVDESDSPGDDFLSGVCQKWEAAARGAEEHGVRSVQMRIGVVLGPGGGALAKMVAPMGVAVLGPVGRGDNHVSWIHVDDVVGMILMAIDDATISGAVNCTSPYWVTFAELCAEMASVLDTRRIGTPAALARIGLGDSVSVLTGNQQVYPKRAIEAGYEYHYAQVTPALEASLIG